MDGCSGKRSLMEPRKRHNITCEDSASDRDQKPQPCNRIGCSGRTKYNESTKIGCPDKAKCIEPSFCSSNGKEIIENSPRSSSIMVRGKRSFHDSKRKVPSKLEFDSSESSKSGNSEAPEFISSPSKSLTVTEVGCSSVQPKIRPRERFHNKFGPNNPNSPVNTSNNHRSLYGLRNMKSNSISDVVPICSSSDSQSLGKNGMKNKSTEGESSTGRKTTLRSSVDGPYYPPTSGISISEDNREGATSVRTRRSMNVNNSRMRHSYGQDGRNSVSLQEPDSEITSNVGEQSPYHQFSANGSSSGSSSSSNGDSWSSMMPFTPTDLGFTRFMNRGAFQRYDIDGIAEVLLALERIEHEQALTQEQLLALENGLFLSGLNLYDQHRDMRLDIDNMSYEELLALEERMGTVSTALSEEALSKCLRRSMYQGTLSEFRVSGSGEDGDGIKCSICQEEYVLGDEIGHLVECEHGYHAACIYQWLRVKNWCPICKAEAAPPHSSKS